MARGELLSSSIRFRKDQENIMQYRSGTMAVPAVPGAGKTFIIANLSTKLIKENNKRGKKLLIVTYMNSSVNNFKSRIAQFLNDNGIHGSNKYEVMTIHSLAMKILKEKPSAVAVGEEFRIVDDFNVDDILYKIITRWRDCGGEACLRWFLNKNSDDNFERWNIGFFSVVKSLIGELKLQGVSSEVLKDNLDTLKNNSILKLIAPIYIRYCNELKLRGYLDYNDLLILSLKALQEDEKLRAKLQKRYIYIFEDECQDSNFIQGRLLSILSDEHKNLIRVGDVNQSITGTFSSSNPRFFKEFCESAEATYSMFMASRSSIDIINLANDLIDYVNNNLEEEQSRDALMRQLIEPVKEGFGKSNPTTENYQITTVSFATNQEERNKIVASIEGFIDKYPNKTIGILVPSNEEIKSYAALLEERNIQYEELSRMPQDRIKVVEEIALVLAYLSNPDDKESLIKIIEQLFIKKEDADSFIDEILNSKLYPIDELIIDISEKLYSARNDLAMAQSIASYTKQIIIEEKLSLKEVSNIIKEKTFIFSRVAETIYESEGFEPKGGCVTICTYHKSKGLEFDRVHLTALTSYNFPTSINGSFNGEYYYLKEEYKNPIALGKSEIENFIGKGNNENPFIEAKREYIRERARLLYVGITRAKEFLIISTHKSKVGYKRQEKVSEYFNFLKEKVESR